MNKIKEYQAIIIIVLLILAFTFYWYSYRPSKIKADCTKQADEISNTYSASIGIGKTVEESNDSYLKYCLGSHGL